MKKEFIGIDLLRFMCAFSVMMCHLLPIVSSDFNWARYGGTGVNVFFCISGFIIPLSSEGRSPFEFIKSRIVRLGPGVWICATISAVTFISIKGLQFEHDMIGKYTRSIFFVPFAFKNTENLGEIWIDGAYWTLFVEISFYILIFIVLSFNNFNFVAPLSTILGAITLSYWVIYFSSSMILSQNEISIFIQHTAFKRYFDLTLVHHGAWFGLGISIWRMMTYRWQRSFATFCICLIGAFLECAHRNESDGGLSILPSLIYCAIGILIIIISINYADEISNISGRSSRIFRLIGLTTYPLYLLHDRFGKLLVELIVSYLKFSTLTATLTTMAIVTTISFFIAAQIEPKVQSITRKIVEKSRRMLEPRSAKGLFRPTSKFNPG